MGRIGADMRHLQRPHRLQHAHADGAGTLGVRLVQHHGEFLAADARAETGGLVQRLRQRGADRTQTFVAAQMAVDVVVLLEEVDVDQHQPERRATLLRGGQQHTGLALEEAPVEQAGQRVAIQIAFDAQQLVDGLVEPHRQIGVLLHQGMLARAKRADIAHEDDAADDPVVQVSDRFDRQLVVRDTGHIGPGRHP